MLENGVPCVIVMAGDRVVPTTVRMAGECGFGTYCWNASATVFFYLVLTVPGGPLRRHPRWMRAREDPIVQAIRRRQRFLVTVANTHGEHSGWYEADFRRRSGTHANLSASLEGLFAIAAPGIPYSHVQHRFDPTNRLRFNDHNADEIPVFADHEADYWNLLAFKQAPWHSELEPRDIGRSVWGVEAWGARHRAAAAVQVVIDRQRFDKQPPTFDQKGLPLVAAAADPILANVSATYPELGAWLAAVDGSEPDAKRAHEAVVAALHHPAALAVAVRLLLTFENGLDDVVLLALHKTFIAALLDSRVTQHGTMRPSLSTFGDETALHLRTVPIDLEVPADWLETMWGRATTEWTELLNVHHHVGQSEFPMPVPALIRGLQHVALDGTLEEAEARVDALLLEAQQARQWSIPWGARVQIRFGPFDGLRIFEIDGGFHCRFVDQRELYYQVVLRLDSARPDAEAGFVGAAVGDATPNAAAVLCAKLLAAAVVRDFLVVEERESVFGIRQETRSYRGRSVVSVTYLPRVRYIAPRLSNLPTSEDVVKRLRHQVTAHLRRSGTATAGQRFLAMKYGIRLPQGFTFVRPHERGVVADAERVRLYRSRSASRLLFEELSQVPAGSRPEWFDFEKHCQLLLEKRGLTVVHQAATRGADRGVDLFAAAADGQTYVVQCKCWSAARVVPPSVVRELAGAIQLADGGNPVRSRGILITTSRFSSGAASAAHELGFELIDGSQVAQLASG